MNKQGKIHFLGNGLGLFLICGLLIFAFVDQLTHHDLPCPLCLLQRICYVAIGLAMLMNLRLGFRSAHYGLMILATLLGLGISLRQVYLHLAIGDAGYGSLFLGEYLYTWSAIGFLMILVFIAIALLLDRSFFEENKIQNRWIKGLIGLFLFLILANGVSTFIECGPFTCPSDPTQYYF